MDGIREVRLTADRPSDEPTPFLDELRRADGRTVRGMLDALPAIGPSAPLPGAGRTRELWEGLASLAAADLELVRVLEPHLDALAILAQAGVASADAASIGRSWGVFAAEGPGVRLDAIRDVDDVDDDAGSPWRLDGVKPWCSLAGVLDAALVTAWTGPEQRGLFAVRLRDDRVEVDDGDWHARGLVNIPSGSVRFRRMPAVAIGEPGWYQRRPGFAIGGIGVAACWYGGAVGVARTVLAGVRARPSSELLAMHVGAIDEALAAARSVLAEAAAASDSGGAEGTAGSLLAKRVRGVVATAVETVLRHAAHALGPAPLATDADHARRVADLQLYVRQHHAERDQASLGTSLLRVEAAPW